MSFPEHFVWGAAAASYQIEGAAAADGKGPSIWDMFCKRPGAIYNNNTGDTACDHYHRYQNDVALMAEVGLQAYRLSLSWPRILPEGTGAVNEAGLSFYDRLVDALLAHNIQPYVTLYHWDLPLALYYRGGWLNPYVSDWFADYTEIVAKRLGDRVKHWMTFNEPAVFTVVGYHEVRHAPGDRYAMSLIWRMSHQVLVAHGKASRALRSAIPDAQIGMANAGRVAIPVSDTDVDAARRHMFEMKDPSLWQHSWWNDPIMFGHYPEAALKTVAPYLPDGFEKDLETIHAPCDFYGLNVYLGSYVRSGEHGKPEEIMPHPGHPVTVFHWNVTPDCLYWGPRLLHERYTLPIWITENGLSNMDWVSLDGKVHDPQRIDFTQRYLRALRRAGEDGTPIGGYFHWSILDNFEWGEGYKHRFGLIHVDFVTQQRTLKDSAHWYREVIRSNGEILG